MRIVWDDTYVCEGSIPDLHSSEETWSNKLRGFFIKTEFIEYQTRKHGRFFLD